MTVTALLDEAQPFKDTLHILVTDGADTPIALEAAGTGSTVVCEPLAAGRLDFGHQLAKRAWSVEMVVSNMGRKDVSLQWGSARADELAKAFSKQAKGTGACDPGLLICVAVDFPQACPDPLGTTPQPTHTHQPGKKFDLAAVPPDQAPVFSISPDRIVLGPKEAITTTITGFACKAGQVRFLQFC